MQVIQKFAHTVFGDFEKNILRFFYDEILYTGRYVP